MNVGEYRQAVIQIGVALEDAVDVQHVTMAFKHASAAFSALMAGSNNPLAGQTAAYLANVAQEAFYWEGKTGEVMQRLEEFAATIQ